jgi:hypothetical protein
MSPNEVISVQMWIGMCNPTDQTLKKKIFEMTFLSFVLNNQLSMSFCKELAPSLNAGKKNSDIVLENLGFKINLFDMDHYNEYLRESS